MISIISAIYKSEKYLPAFLENVKKFVSEIENSGQQIEIIIVPTNPSLQEKQLLDTVKNEKWCVIHEYNKPGLYAAWNEGFSIAKGEIMGAWNVDDVRFSEAVIDAVKLFKNGAKLVYFPFNIYRYINILGLPILVYKKNISKQIPEFNQKNRARFYEGMHCGPFFMFTKALYKAVGPFDEQFKIVADYDWCVRAAKLSEHLVKSNVLAGKFRVDGTGLSSGWSERHRVENNIVYLRHGLKEKVQELNSTLKNEYDITNIKFKNNKIPFA